MKKFRVISTVLFLGALFIKFISSRFPSVVEEVYSKNIDVYIVKILSRLNSTFDFSYFEILIYIFIFSIILAIIYLVYIIVTDRKRVLRVLKNILLNYIAVVFLIYFLFIVLWGVNYNRVKLSDTIINMYNLENNTRIKNINLDEDDLYKLCDILIEKCNKSKKMVNNLDSELKKDSIKNMILKLEPAYEKVEFLDLNKLGSYSKAKIILNSSLLSYTGITGIYSPFTGEANVNINQPMVSLPFTILHEMAHQRGYANESEANFLAYIACIENEDSYVNYSGYFMALRYSLSAMASSNYEKYTELVSKIDEDVVYDLKEYSSFWKKYQSKAGDISDSMNNIYLKSNRVEEGIKSYNNVVDLLLLYYYLYN